MLLLLVFYMSLGNNSFYANMGPEMGSGILQSNGSSTKGYDFEVPDGFYENHEHIELA